MASLILGSIGSAFLGPIGGFIGSAIGSLIDQWLFAPKPEDQYGPRLDDLTAVSADPGKAIPLVYGADRIPGIVVHTTDLIETVHKEEIGGKGPPTATRYTYTYHVDIDYMVSEGPILGIGRMWADGRLIRGTWYQMELDTKENFEKIGGIPYKDWYWGNRYDAEKVPWTYDPNYTPTVQPQKYIWSEGGGFTPISDERAQTILDQTKQVVYAYDTGSEKYLPIPESHAYTGEKLKKKKSSTLRTKSAKGSFRNPPTTSNNGGRLYIGDAGEGETIKDSWATLTVIGFTSGNWNNGIFGADLGFTSAVSGSINFKDTDGFGSNSDTEGFQISTPSADKASGRPPPNPQTRSFTLTVEGNTGFDTVEYNVEAARSLFSFQHYVDVDYTVTVNQLIGSDDPPLRDWPDYYNFYDAINDWSPKSVLQFDVSEGVAFYPGHVDQISDPTMEGWANEFNDGDCGVPAYIGRAHIVFQRFELEDFGNRIPNINFEVVQSDEARIRPIIEDLMRRADVDEEFYDISALPDEGVRSYVLGYTIGSVTSYRAAMEPLIDGFEVDASEIGNEIVFRPKRRPVDYTIDWNDLATKESGGEPQPPLRLALRDEITIPVALDVKYKDPEREYQPSTARFDRQVAPGVQRSVTELSIVREPHIMKEFTRDKMRDLWLESISGSWSLPQKYQYISPSDLIHIQGSPEGKSDFTFKLTTTVRRPDGSLEVEGVRQDSSLYEPLEGETVDNGQNLAFNTQSVNGYRPVTRFYLLDIPPLRKDDNNDGFYYALGGQSFRWPGGSIYRQVSDTDYQEVTVSLSNARMGTVLRVNNFNKEESLYSADTESTIEVVLFNKEDSLNSVSDAFFFQLDNVALIGDEIVGFKNATNKGDGVWELDTFLRARLDTWHHANEHVSGERFILLTPFEIGTINDDVHDIDTSFNYGSATLGESPVSIEDDLVLFENSGERLKPFSPAMLHGVYDNLTNNWYDLTISWVRQNRFDFSMPNGPRNGEFPNSEAFEKYEVDIVDKRDDTVVRTFTVSDATQVLYDAATRESDGLSCLYTKVMVYQISDVVGRGNPSIGEFACP